MKKYEKPVVMVNEELAEGVYAGSGDCFENLSVVPSQEPYWYDQSQGLYTYTYKISTQHNAADGHGSESRTVEVVFNQEVIYNGISSGTTIGVYMGNWINATTLVGDASFTVQSKAGLSIESYSISCQSDLQ